MSYESKRMLFGSVVLVGMILAVYTNVLGGNPILRVLGLVFALLFALCAIVGLFSIVVREGRGYEDLDGGDDGE